MRSLKACYNMYRLPTLLVVMVSIFVFTKGHDVRDIKRFNQSMDFRNNAARMLDEAGSDREMSEQMGNIMGLNKKALNEALKVNIQKLNNHYRGFGDNYQSQFIQGLQLLTNGYDNEKDEEFIRGQVLLDMWNDWYGNNHDGIRSASRTSRTIWLFLILFAGYGIGVYAFANLWFPLSFVLPRLLRMNAKLMLNRSLSVVLLFTLAAPFIWIAILGSSLMAVKYFLLPSYFKAYGIGLALGAIHCWFGARKRDVEEDFISTYARFLK